jgi:hypothetical protein
MCISSDTDDLGLGSTSLSEGSDIQRVWKETNTCICRFGLVPLIS